jgi:hypothetical protein
LALPLALGCGGEKRQGTVEAATKTVPVTFTDATEEAGIRFVHNSGAFGKKWMPETMGAGAAFLDFDGDGWQDLYLVNGRDWTDAERREAKLPPAASRRRTTGILYRNNRGKFEDVTKKAGLDVELYGMGVTAGDYDNDGHVDLYLTGLGRNYLFRNTGNGTFQDVSERAGVKDQGWSTSASWVDYDKDGDLDLFVCHYVKWSPSTDIYCTLDGKQKSYCTPQSYTGEPSKLYRNEGKSGGGPPGTFKDVTAAANILKSDQGQVLQGKSLGVTICDYNNDGWPDIAVANDTEPNYLFHNNGDGTFKEVGATVGVAYSESGEARGAMGIDAADYNHTGRDSFVIGNFSNEMVALYQNQGSGLFIDVAPSSEVGQASLLFLAFGCFFFDMDNDGWQDLFTSNGHVEDDIQNVQKDVSHAQRPLLFRNAGGGRFTEVGKQSGNALQKPVVGRGAAYADYDLDGDTDILLCVNRGPARLLRNEGGSANGAVRVQLVGATSNRSAIGAVLQVKVGADTRRYLVRAASSYCSQSELPVQIGLGGSPRADAITIQWPSGATTPLTAVNAGQKITVREGEGVVASEPFAVRRASAR